MDRRHDGLASACLVSSCLLPHLNDRRIFIYSLIAFLGHSSRGQPFLSLEVCLTGFLVLSIESSLGDCLQSHLNMRQELLRASLVEDSDGQHHLFRDFDLDGAIFGGVLGGSWNVGGGWFISPRAPLTFMGLEAFWD